MTNKKAFDFIIVEKFSFDDAPIPIDERARKLLQETFTAVNSKKKNLEEKLIKYVDEYPLIPQFKNRLASYYQITGKGEKAKIINALTLEDHPDYLFGKVGAAMDCYTKKEYDRIPALLGGKLELDALYPDRKVFQIAEVITYYKVVALYLNATRKSKAGMGCN